MGAERKSPAEDTSDREIITARVFDAPRAGTYSPMVGAKWLYHHNSRDGRKTGWCLAVHHAWPRWRRL